MVSRFFETDFYTSFRNVIVRLLFSPHYTSLACGVPSANSWYASFLSLQLSFLYFLQNEGTSPVFLHLALFGLTLFL